MKFCVWFSILLVAGASLAGGAERGSVVLELPPGPGNPRNSEGAFLALRGGGILFVYSRFAGETALDAAKAGLAARVSMDDGRTWSEDRPIATPGEATALNVMSVSLLRLQNGDAGLFYMLRRSAHDLRPYLRRSADEGRTWGEPVCCAPATGYYVMNNDRAVRLASGRIVLPLALHRSKSDVDDLSALDWRALTMFLLSGDDGRTWREAKSVLQLASRHTESGLQEPGVVELLDGRLWGWARTDLGRQYEFFSSDGGDTWTQPEPSRFTSPLSPLAMKRIPGSEPVRLLAVWNPAPAYETRVLRAPGGDRTPLVYATGGGPDAPAWSAAQVLEGGRESDPTAGYCYTAIHFTRDAVLLAYCAGGERDGNRLSRLRLRRLPRSVLE